MNIVTQALVVDKYTSNGTDRNGNQVTYYNVKLGIQETCESQIIGVPEDVYKQIQVGKVNRIGGRFGGLKTKWWAFDKFLGVEK